MRSPCGGRRASEALVRMTIQWALSQFFALRVKRPVKTAPALSSTVSPQRALSNAACRLPPGGTVTMLPGVGVSKSELATVTRGSSAGPSKGLFAEAGEIEIIRNEIVIMKIEANEYMMKTPFWFMKI